MIDKYVLSFWDCGRKRYIRVYQDGRHYVVRKHAITATQFFTKADAEAVKAKFILSNCDIELFVFRS